MMTAIMAKTKTAPAATSLACFANGRCSSVTKSTTRSSAVLTSSSEITAPIAKSMMSHSVIEIENPNPQRQTSTVKVKWIRRFLSIFTAWMMPSIAYENDLKTFLASALQSVRIKDFLLSFEHDFFLVLRHMIIT